MSQDRFEIWMMEYLSGELDDSRAKEFENYLQDHPHHKEEFEAMSSTWNQIESNIPETDEKMDARFYEMLHSEIDKAESKGVSWIEKVKEIFGSFRKPQWVIGMMLLGIGLTIGYFSNSHPSEISTREISTSKSETDELRGQLVLTLLDQTSANKRLQGVNEAAKLNDANELVIKALFTTLNNDVNINVRLVAVESLAKYVETPEVRMGLVKSIALQDSPLVQIALADLMVALQEKTSIESMKQLLEKPDIDTTVKQKLEESINHII